MAELCADRTDVQTALPQQPHNPKKELVRSSLLSTASGFARLLSIDLSLILFLHSRCIDSLIYSKQK